MPQVITYRHAADFLDRAEAWLLGSEAKNNLILSVAARVAADGSDSDEHLFATVEVDGQVAGCAFRTPPWKLVVTDFPADAVASLVDLVRHRYPDLTAVLGPGESARTFAAEWSQRFRLTFRPGMHQRVYELRSVVKPDVPARGHPRPAGESDMATLVDWLAEFHVEVGFPLEDPEVSAAHFIGEGEAWMWCDPDPVSLAVCTGHTRNGVRIGLVFTPRDRRGNGYASAVTAALSQHALDAGKRACFLFADVANPTSNKIYRRIGFKPVSDVVDFLIEPQR